MRYAILILLVFLVGCDNESTTTLPGASKQPSVANKEQKLVIVLLGDDIRLNVAKHLMSDGSLEIVAPLKDADAGAIADVASKSDFVHLVTDATQGPLPVHHEHSMILRQLGITSIGLLSANTKQLAKSDALELLEFEELELREVLNTYGLPGDDATCFHDTKLPAVNESQRLILGIPATREWLKRQSVRSRPTSPSTTANILLSSIYLMAKQESAHAKPLAHGDSIHVFIHGHVQIATVQAESQLALGSSSPAALRFQNPVACAIGDRFLVIVNGHTIGAGAITNIGR